MSFKMMNPDRRDIQGIGQGPGQPSPHQQGTGQSRSLRIGDAGQRGQGLAGLRQHLAQQRGHAPDMVARGQFRHHAAVVLVHRHLGMQRMGQQPAFGVVQGQARFVAGGFDAEDEHWGLVHSVKARYYLRLFPVKEAIFMPHIKVKENEPFDVALRRFKRAVEKTGLLTELRAREFYEKPTSERKRKLAAAVKRTHKRLRGQMLPPKMY